MTPEAKIKEFAKRIHLQDEDVKYLVSLVRDGRLSGIRDGIDAEREACARLAEEWTTPQTIPLDFGPVHVTGLGRPIAAAIRARGQL